jgi:hypothetical protein
MFEAAVTTVLIGAFLLIAAFAGLLVHRLFRHTSGPTQDG